MSLTKHRKQLIRVLAAGGIAAGAALLWFTLHGPERGRNPLAVSMETESAAYFASERDLTTLTQDVQSGSAAGIGLSSEYALVSRRDGTRYYVHMDSQRALVPELVKGGQSSTAPEIFALDHVQPPGPPLATFRSRVRRRASTSR